MNAKGRMDYKFGSMRLFWLMKETTGLIVNSGGCAIIFNKFFAVHELSPGVSLCYSSLSALCAALAPI